MERCLDVEKLFPTSSQTLSQPSDFKLTECEDKLPIDRIISFQATDMLSRRLDNALVNLMDPKSFSEDVDGLPHCTSCATNSSFSTMYISEFPSSALKLDVILSNYAYT